MPFLIAQAAVKSALAAAAAAAPAQQRRELASAATSPAVTLSYFLSSAAPQLFQVPCE